MEETRNVNDTEMLVLWTAELNGEDIIRESLFQVVHILLSAWGQTHSNSSLEGSAHCREGVAMY